MLDIIHHLSAGFKAYWADYTYLAMDEMRQACGGAGYLLSSGIALTWKNGAPHPTHEGVNVVMMQQSSRLLLKQMRVLEQGKKCQGLMSYLNDLETLITPKAQATTLAQFISLDHLELALASRAAYAFSNLAKVLNQSNLPQKEKLNEVYALDIDSTTKLHIEYLIISVARQHVKNHRFNDPRINDLLETLMQIFAVKLLMKNSEGLYEIGFFGAGSKRLLQDSFRQLLVEIRPHLLSLVEDWPQIDTAFSTIGNKWGDIYESQLDFAKNSRLNKQQVPPYYESLIKPIMNQRKHKL